MTKKLSLLSLGLAGACVILAARAGCAQKWDKTYVQSLPDSAFAAVEELADGRKLRLLPHHDVSGKVDAPHLRSALRLWSRVKWQSPQQGQEVLAHLKAHGAGLCQEGRMSCARSPKPAPRAARPRKTKGRRIGVKRAAAKPPHAKAGA